MSQRIVVDNAVAVDDDSSTVASFGLTPASVAPIALQQPSSASRGRPSDHATATGSYSTGRGGAGNIVGPAKSGSPSHSPAHSHSQSRSRERTSIFNRAARSKSRTRARTREPPSPTAAAPATPSLRDRLAQPALSAPTHVPEGAKDLGEQDGAPAEPAQAVIRERRVDVPFAIAE
jgi:hypothetical protein